MPELPDVVVYVEALERRVVGAVLAGIRLASPFLLRTVDPPIASAIGTRVHGVERAKHIHRHELTFPLDVFAIDLRP